MSDGPDLHDEEGEGLVDLSAIGRRALDLFVYAPAGFALSAIEEFPEFAEKGRTTIELQVNNARVLGKFAVTMGRAELQRRVAKLTESRSAREPAPGTPAARPTPESAPNESTDPGAEEAPWAPSPASANGSAHVVAGPPEGPVDLAVTRQHVDAAIADYDALSASQVVRRLDSLRPDELEAVYRHEAATRRRRTILHRSQQLLGIEVPPGTAIPPG